MSMHARELLTALRSFEKGNPSLVRAVLSQLSYPPDFRRNGAINIYYSPRKVKQKLNNPPFLL